MTKSTRNLQLETQRQYLTNAGVADVTVFDDHVKLWWRNPTNHNSLRLTAFGLTFFTKNLKLTPTSVTISSPYNLKMLLQLERLFTAPYFLKKSDILLFSEQDAIMLQLHAGNLKQYLDNLETNKD